MRLSPDKQKKLAIVVVLGLAVLGSGYYFGFRWIHLEKTKTAEREQMLRGELQKTKRIIDSADQADEKTEAIRKSLAGMRDGLPPQQAETWLANEIYGLAAKHQLSINGLRLTEPDAGSAGDFKDVPDFGVVGYGFSVQGNYFQLGEFLADLESNYPLMQVETLSIAAGAGGAPQLHDMSIVVSMVTRKG